MKVEMQRHIAYHEAGHALLAVLYGREVTRVSLTKGQTGIDPRELERIAAKQEELTEDEQRHVLEDVKIAMGGYLGELVGIGRAVPNLGSDLARMNRVIKLLSKRIATGFGLQDEVRTEIEASRDALDRIALALLREKEITGDRVKALVRGPVDNSP